MLRRSKWFPNLVGDPNKSGYQNNPKAVEDPTLSGDHDDPEVV